MANKVIVTFKDATTDTTTGVTSVTTEPSPARLVIVYTEGGVSKSKVFNWDEIKGYKVEPDS